MTPLTRWILSFTLAYVFIAFGADKLMHPTTWIGWMPLWMNGFMGSPTDTWLIIVGLVEIFLGTCLLIPWGNIHRLAAFFSALHLLGIIIVAATFSTSIWNDQVIVRDLGLFAIAMALVF